MKDTLKLYYRLTKPGIIYGNLLTAIAGFFLGAMGHFHLGLFLAMSIGTSLSIGSACVLNNYIDRNIDKKMTRTKNRALATGTISVRNAIIYAGMLGIAGIVILYFYTNLLTVVVGLIGVIDYLLFYGIGKRKSVHGTLIGAISGATPIVAGYTAATNRFDLTALLLFLVLVVWQMPHFYAIAIYRLKDYTAAHIPVMPVVKGISATKIQILIYILVFFLSILLLSFFGHTGAVFLITMGALSMFWLYKGVLGFGKVDDEKWARTMFVVSLLIITGLSLIIPLDSILMHGILFVW